jgi:hypothetical protein
MDDFTKEQMICHPCYCISAQQFANNRTITIYTITNLQNGKKHQISAKELYEHDDLLSKFNAADIRNISYTAIMENEVSSAEIIQRIKQNTFRKKLEPETKL